MGAVGSAAEVQAEQVAHRVVWDAPDPSGRAGAVTSPPPLTGQDTGRHTRIGAEMDQLSDRGEPLGPADRAFFETRLGRHLDAVRVHHDAAAGRLAAAVGARAFTVGSDVVFGSGEYAPSSPAGRRLLAHELAHVVQQQSGGRRVLQRQPTGGGATHTPPARISTAAFWGAYQRVGYNVWQGEENVDQVWEFIGGNVGKSFAGQNTCATRVSYGLDYGGAPIAHYDNTVSFHNDPHTTFRGKAGDGKNYIVGAPAMAAHLTAQWGPPDARLTTNDQVTAFAATLTGTQGAIFAGPHHSGLIMKGYRDPYVFTDPGVMPVQVWKLP